MPNFGGTAEHLTSIYKYVKITDDTSGASADIWDPAAGRRLHITGILVSAEDKGTVEIRDKTAATIIAVMAFLVKGTVPFELGSDLSLPKDHVLEAKFTAGASVVDVHITVIGHEH